PRSKKMSSSRKHHLKVLHSADQYSATSNSSELKLLIGSLKPNIRLCVQDTARKLHSLIDKMDEERYDLATKVRKADKEINDLKLKVVELAGVKKPPLKKVRMTADAMLKALLGARHAFNMDLRANLKQVKKEVKEEPSEAVGDWRKNIEDKADRKKMFETS
uniref:Troponin I2, fast skeletal type n=1 Tax=Mola mola TaxID=94237 RepID=A0A3Q3XFE3_MOLML